MLNILSLDIPQLPVDAIRESGMNKEVPAAIRQYFINEYLNECFNQLNARHELINTAIRNAYFIHQDCLESRQASNYYTTGEQHYLELAYIDSISLSLIQSTVQLVTLIHCMNHINKTNSYPSESGLKSILQELISDPSVWNNLSVHIEFINTIAQIQQAISSPFAHAHTEYFLIEDDPTIFTPVQTGVHSYNVIKVSLRRLIEQYSQFFQSAKNILRQCSPETIRLITQWN